MAKTFSAFQQDVGFFSTSKQALTISFCQTAPPDKYYFIRLEGGYPQQLPRKSFRVSELLRVCASSNTCREVVNKVGKSAGPHTVYNMFFIFQVSKSCLSITIF